MKKWGKTSLSTFYIQTTNAEHYCFTIEII